MQADMGDADRATRETKGSMPAGAQQTLSTVISAAKALAAALEADSNLDQAANKPCCPGTSFELKTEVRKASCVGIARHPGVDLSSVPSTNASTAVSTGISTQRSLGLYVKPNMHHSLKPSTDRSVQSSLHHGLSFADPSRAPSAAMCTNPSMQPSMDPSASLCTDPSVDPQSGSMSNDCPVHSAVSNINLTIQLPPSLSQAPSPATDPNLGTDFELQPLPIPVGKPTPKPLSTPVAKVTPKSLSTPGAKFTPRPLSTPVADNSLSPNPSPSSGATPEPAMPLPRLRSFDLFLDQSQISSMVTNSPKLMLNPSQSLAEAEHQPVSETWAAHDLVNPPASATPPPFTPTAGRSPSHAPSADPKKGLNLHSVPLDCQIPGLLSDPSLDSWARTATDLTHNLPSNSNQGFRCGVSTDLTDCAAPALPTESSLGLKQVQRAGELPLGKSSQSRGELPKDSYLPKGSAYPMNCEQPMDCEFPKGNLLTTGKNLMGSSLTFPFGGPSPMGWGLSSVNRGLKTATAYPVGMNANACEKLCFGSLDDFLSSCAEPASLRVSSLSPGATGFAIMAEPLDQADHLLRPPISPGATVCAIVTHQPFQVQPTIGGSHAEVSAQLQLPECTHACSTPPCGGKNHNGKGAAASASAELPSAAFVGAASPAVAAVSPAVGPSTPGGTTEVLYPEPREQVHAVSTVSHSVVADGSSRTAVSASFLGASHPDDSEMPWAKGPSSAGLQMAHAQGKGCHAASPAPSRRQHHYHSGVASVQCSSASSEDSAIADKDECSCEGCWALQKCKELMASSRYLSCTEQQALLDELVDIQVSKPLTCAQA